MNISAKIGDLFCIPLDATSFGAGVVAGKWQSELYLVLFKEVFADSQAFGELGAGSLTPIFASSSLDAKIWHGHWPLITRNADISWIVQPLYKVEEPGGTVAESFDRKFRRSINPSAAARLRYRRSVAPVRLENALKAYHGYKVWEPAFDELAYEKVVESNGVVD